ncbi:hypothetical protein JHN63_33280 [Streptomyces sp. MBT65]|uniref:hypothetical protein n=1 Tax=Streptomyces sp. MBT65 TaxID=1488395 RepID=UPI001909E36D|nr:hypothetical protein [Streptomyces sp. MBT65]MBK3578588.1 hypothetical protein [Streptomyces sp. MBT65]
MSQSATPSKQPQPQPEAQAQAQPQAPAQPQPQPVDGNPYAQQPGAVPPPPPAAYAPPAPPKNNIALGLVTAVAAALIAAGIYGVVIGTTKHEIGWAAVGVGFVIGLAAGRLGGRNPALPVVSAVLALGAVYLGQLVGDAMLIADEYGVNFGKVFFDHFGVVQDAWKADSDPLTFVFFAIAAFAAFSGAKKAAL